MIDSASNISPWSDDLCLSATGVFAGWVAEEALQLTKTEQDMIRQYLLSETFWDIHCYLFSPRGLQVLKDILTARRVRTATAAAALTNTTN